MAIQEIKVDNAIYSFEGVTSDEAEKLRSLVLTDPTYEESKVNSELPVGVIRIGYKPGVTDPIEASLFRTARLINIFPLAVSSSREYKKEEAPDPSQIQTVIKGKLDTLIYEGTPIPVENISITRLEDSTLSDLSKNRGLFLNLEEMSVIRDYYRNQGREPTDVEIETFAQTWSEHCSHKTFKANLVDEKGREKPPMIERIKESSGKNFERADVVTAFKDNAGGMRFYDGYVIIGKVESHISPVAIEPYAGSLTKIGGVLRDPAGTGQGGQNLIAFMVNNFASPYTLTSDIPSGCLHPKHVLLENSRGEREYGNPMGIPTHGITLHFHKDFVAKATSLGGVIGLIPENRTEKGKPERGDLIVAVGGKTGRDGIHGATFSSGEMNEKTQTIHSTSVQLGDPIVEKTMFDALLKCRDANLIRAITDCGAGGFSSAIGEMADGIGANVYLDRVATKYAGLSSWEKWLSESQERMVVAIKPENWEEFRKICEIFDTNANIVGDFSGDNQLRIFDNNELVGDIDLQFLHHGLPQRKMKMCYSGYPEDLRVSDLPEDYNEAFKVVLSHLNVCSKKPMHEMYDKSVQGMTVLSPYVGVNQDVPSDGSIVAPFADKAYGVVTTHAVNPILNRIDPYWGSVWAFASAATKYTAIGGNINEANGIDNYISPFPDEESLGNLDKMTDGLCDMIKITHVPMVSGKDSLSSTYRGTNGQVIKVPPSLNITIFGRIPDIEKTVSCDFKKVGSTICLVGKLDINNMGGSVYFDTQGIVGSNIPKVDTQELVEVLETVNKAINEGRIKSSKAIGEGGIAAALSQMCFGGNCGARIDISTLNAKRPDFALFNETAGCMLVEVESWDEAQELFGDIHFEVLGTTTMELKIEIHKSWDTISEIDLFELREAWQKPMEEILDD